jgi:hypothetical protein
MKIRKVGKKRIGVKKLEQVMISSRARRGQ